MINLVHPVHFVLPVPCKRSGVWLKELFSKLCSRKKKLAMAECVGGAVFVSSGTAQSQSAQHYYRPMERKASGGTRAAGQKGIVSIPLARHVHSGKMCAACPLVSCRCTSLLLLHFLCLCRAVQGLSCKVPFGACPGWWRPARCSALWLPVHFYFHSWSARNARS